MPLPILLVDILHELITYDNGLLFWKERDIKWFKTKRACNTWNSKFAGKEAGTLVDFGCKSKYKYISILNKKYYYHRIVWAIHYGYLPEEMIDHIDRDGTNNKIENLRLADKSINMQNCQRRKSNTSGFTGVYNRGCGSKPWQAYIRKDGIRYIIGHYKTPEEAAQAYNNKALELYGENAMTNEICLK